MMNKRKLREAKERAVQPENDEWIFASAEKPFAWVFGKIRGSWLGKKFHEYGTLCQSVSGKSRWKPLSEWVSSFFEPEREFPSLEKKATLARTIADILLATYLFGVVTYLSLAILSFAAQGKPEMEIMENVLDPQVAAFSLFAEPLMGAFQAILMLVMLYLCARLLGSKSGLWGATYPIAACFIGWRAVVSVLSAILAVLTAIASVSSSLSIIGVGISLVVVLASIAVGLAAFSTSMYGGYAMYKMARLSYRLARFKTALAILLAAILSFLANYALAYATGIL